MQIGVLAVQGAFAEHINALQGLHIDSIEIRKKSDLQNPMDGLILPGGESTVMGKLLRELDLFDPLRDLIAKGLPVFGTCAGLILLARSISNQEERYFGGMDLVARRNAYGRQMGSFQTVSQFQGIGEVPMTFIRAPFIESVSADVEVLARVDGKIVAAQQKNMLVTSFHPELTEDLRVHKYFVARCRAGH